MGSLGSDAFPICLRCRLLVPGIPIVSSVRLSGLWGRPGPFSPLSTSCVHMLRLRVSRHTSYFCAWLPRDCGVMGHLEGKEGYEYREIPFQSSCWEFRNLTFKGSSFCLALIFSFHSTLFFFKLCSFKFPKPRQEDENQLEQQLPTGGPCTIGGQ